jgi:hypothetical protein
VARVEEVATPVANVQAEVGPPGSEPEPRRALPPAEIVGGESRKRIDVHLEMRGRWNTVASLSDLTQKVAHEYEDRFLIELIQNGYDAHGRGSSGGRIWVLLDETLAGHGVLYVANTGRPFEFQNFDSLSNIAQSSKPPGEGIGNKGLGFRSVLQVCEWPEVYSSSPSDSSDPGFGGYCFGFATDHDLRRLAMDDAEFELVDRDFSRYLLPVPRTPKDSALSAFRARGAVTVVRLPLKSEAALEVARAQIARLVEASQPVLLFLDRLDRLDVEHIGEGGALVRHSLTRSSSPVDLAVGPQTDCSEVETADHRYLLAKRVVPNDQVRAVIQRTIDAQQLDPAWNDWDGDAEVSLALPLGRGPDDDDDAFSLFTFLPMDVSSPLGGHLNAPFYTKLARVDLSEDIVLNGYFLEVAADLCAELIALFVGDGSSGLEERAGLVTDLLTWDEQHSSQLEEALVGHGLTLRESKLVPRRLDGSLSWIPLDDAYTWNGLSYAILTNDRLGHIGAKLVDPTIGARRLRRLEALNVANQGVDMTPPDDVLADWLEQLASRLVAPRATIDDWNAFYGDIAKHFERTGRAQSLQGRKIILDEDGKLRRAGPWDDHEAASREPTVYFPPRRAADADDEVDDVAEDEGELHVPRSLQRAVCFLHEDINLRYREGTTTRRTAIVELLEGAKLVERFDRRSILLHLRRVLRGRPADSTKRDALRWVYLQHRASRSGLRGLDDLGLSVPTRDGWRVAEQAFFSRHWRGTQGRELEELLADESAVDSSLGEMRGALLLAPNEWPFALESTEQWQEFLATIGVKDGLWPRGVWAPAIEQDGRLYDPSAVAQHFQLEENVAGAWCEHVDDTWGGYSALAHPYTPYQSVTELWCLPGQENFDGFSRAARHLYAGLVLGSIGGWSDEHFAFAFERRRPQHRTKPDIQQWPSPLRTFVERAEWFPMSDPRRREEIYTVTLGKGWHYDDGDREQAPRFARLCPVGERRRIATNQANRERLVQHGLRTWNDPSTAPDRLAELASLLEVGLIGDVETAAFRVACEKAWAEVVRQLEDEPATTFRNLALVVSKGRDLNVLSPPDSNAAPVARLLYVEDAATGLVHQILEAARRVMLVASPRDGARVTRALEDRDDLDVRLMSHVQANVIADGQVIVPGPAVGDLIVEQFGPWLPRLMAVAITLQASRFVQMTDRLMHDALARLRRIRLVLAANITVTIDEEAIRLPPSVERCLHIEDDQNPVIIAKPEANELGWQQLESVAVSLASLIGQNSAAEPLRIAALSLGQGLDGLWREPTEEELAATFRVSPERISEITAGLRAEIDHLTFFLIPAVACLAGVNAARQVEAASFEHRDELAALLESVVGKQTADRLVDVAERALGADELRRTLEIPFADFNRALRELGRPPIHFVAEHDDAFRSFVATHRDRVLDAIRLHYFPAFKLRVDLSRYTKLRLLPGLEPDPDWLDTFVVPEDELMQRRITDWLGVEGIAPAPGDSRLPSLDTVRQSNEALLDGQLPFVRSLVTAWCDRNSCARPEAWADTLRVRERLQAAGCLDFSKLDASELLAWFETLGLWPAGMLVTAQLGALGLTEEDVAAASTKTEAARNERAQARRSIALDGAEYDVDKESLRRLVKAARDSVTDQFLAATRRTSTLDVIAVRPAAVDKPWRGRGGRVRGRPGPTDEQKEAIGLVGEVLAYQWLIKAYSETTSDSWKSGNRGLGIGGHEGDDSLGYDFEIVQRSQTIHFEVKATAGEECEFEMGVSELRAARSARRNTYRILFIRHVLDRDRRELMVLPNPLEPEYAKHFGQLNEGVKFRFDRR